MVHKLHFREETRGEFTAVERVDSTAPLAAVCRQEAHE